MYAFPFSTINEYYKYAMFAFSVLLNSSSLECFLSSFKKCVILFGTTVLSPSVTKAFDDIQAKFKSLGKLNETDLLEMTNLQQDSSQEEIENGDNLDISEEESIMSSCQKPFLSFFNMQIENMTFDSDNTNPPNPFYQPKWLKLMQKKWLATAPFWSCMLRGMNV